MDDLDYHWDGFADDVLAVIDVLAERQPGEAIVGFGHSKGGAALLLAEQRRPGTFRALYLYEPVVFPFVPEFVGDHPLSVGAERRRPGFGSHEEAIENYSSKAPLDVLHPEALRAYVEHGFEPSPDGGVTLRCLPAHEAQVYRMGVAHDAFAHLGEVGCPVVVARGNVAEPGPASVAAAIAEALPHGTLHALDDLGHFGPLQDPERIADDAAEVLAPS